jgi:lipopolysaccharide/colanic/teichoic acid biosynthesis glycosyltransferase
MDAIYARNKSLILDMKIVMLTVPVVVFAKGSY